MTLNEKRRSQSELTFETDAYFGPNEAIHWPQLAMNRDHRIVIKYTYPEIEAVTGRPVGKYHSRKYRVPETMDIGISVKTLAVQKATQP